VRGDADRTEERRDLPTLHGARSNTPGVRRGLARHGRVQLTKYVHVTSVGGLLGVLRLLHPARLASGS
jgi:hypothetical protein